MPYEPKRISMPSNRWVYSFGSLLLLSFFLLYQLSFEEYRWVNWENFNPDLKEIVLAIEKRGLSSGIGAEGISTEWELKEQKQLVQLSTAPELMFLKDYPNGSIRSLAYHGLILSSEYPLKKKFLEEAAKDTIYQVDYQAGCLAYEMTIPEYLLNIVFKEEYDMLPFQRKALLKYGLKPSDLDILRRLPS
tara:strand:- start:867 stop:1436 length:570 start_codon:yes stop_codon:yes gene_type:complete